MQPYRTHSCVESLLDAETRLVAEFGRAGRLGNGGLLAPIALLWQGQRVITLLRAFGVAAGAAAAAAAATFWGIETVLQCMHYTIGSVLTAWFGHVEHNMSRWMYSSNRVRGPAKEFSSDFLPGGDTK